MSIPSVSVQEKVLKYRPVFVVGTGRSGTSFTAGVLHTKLNICMGDAFNPGSVDGKPTWEDQHLYFHDHRLASGDITLPYYLKCIRALFHERFWKERPWGYKSPMSGYTLHFYMQQLWPIRPVLICAVRPLESVIESCLNRYKEWTPEIAHREIYGRAKLLEILCSGHKTYRIDFSYRRTEEDVESELRGILNGERLDIPEGSLGSATGEPKGVLEGAHPGMQAVPREAQVD